MRKYYYWIVCKDPENDRYNIILGGDSESEAREKGLTMLSGIDFIIKRYPTHDRNQASAYFRGKRLADGAGLHQSTRRLGHEKTLERIKQRRSQRYSRGR